MHSLPGLDTFPFYTSFHIWGSKTKIFKLISEEMRATNLLVLRLKHKIYCFYLVSLQTSTNYRAEGEREEKNIEEVREWKQAKRTEKECEEKRGMRK